MRRRPPVRGVVPKIAPAETAPEPATNAQAPVPPAVTAVTKTPPAVKTTKRVVATTEQLADALIAEHFEDGGAPAKPAAPKAAAAKKSTRGPGRPRKQDISSTAQISGIVAEPADPTDCLELKHHTPSVFRKMVMALLMYNVAEVDMYFDKTGLHIFTPCEHDKNNIYFDVNGACMSWYYCKEPISVKVKVSSLVSMMHPIDRHHDQISFYIKSAAMSKLWCTVHETEMGTSTKYVVDTVTCKQEMPAIGDDDESAYPISFQYSSAELKKTIANAKKVSDRLYIEKADGFELQMRLKQTGLEVVKQLPSDKANLRSDLAMNDFISACVFTAYVKLFTDTIISDFVTISVDRVKPMCFASSTGKRDDNYAFTARVFIKQSPNQD